MATLNLIPIPANSKACKIKGWQNLDYQSSKNLSALKRGNVGWVVPTHLMVLDVDTKAGKVGAESLASLETKYGNLPDCPTQRTASGGLHMVFSLPDGVFVPNSASKVGKDLDIKSGGNGYIVVEPSKIDGKSYTWIKDSPNDTDSWSPPLAPEWLIGLAKGEDSSISEPKKIAPRASYEVEIHDLARIKSRLASIPPEKADEYDAWLKVGLALSNWSKGSEIGLNLWDEWSKQSSKYEASACATRWAGFKPDQVNGVTVSSLYFMAQGLPLNDEGLVERLDNMFRGKIKFCSGIGWLRFEGGLC